MFYCAIYDQSGGYNRDSGGNFCNLFSLLAVLQSYNNPIFDTIRLGFDEWNLHTLRYVR